MHTSPRHTALASAEDTMATGSTEVKTKESAQPQTSQYCELLVCDCYPEHCTHGDTCWCEPEIRHERNGTKIIIHRGAN